MALIIIQKLLDNFNSASINYCHWKSNEHLDAAVNGDTDLDILFDKSQEEYIVEILLENKFHLFEAVWYRKYNGIVDYIGFDIETGKIVHVHTHFNLDIGEVGIKSYRLSWEQKILENKIFDSQYNIYKSSPEVEFLLLVVRTAFKYNTTNKKSNKGIATHFEKEAKWLYNQIDKIKFKQFSSEVVSEEIGEIVEKIRIGEKFDDRLFFSLKKILKPYFAEHRMISSYRVTLLKYIHFYDKVKLKLKKKLNIPLRKSKRNLPNQGIALCLMGSDGAGKSTQTKEITQELAKKIDVLFLYMGSGDGPKSLQRKIVNYFFDMGNNLQKSHKETHKDEFQGKNKKDLSHKSFLKQLIISIKAISVAYEKKNRLKHIEKERNRGVIIICDRYPQTNIIGYNDGPKLFVNINSSNAILRSMAKYELSCYELSQKIYPDLVIKLVGSLDTLHSRRPEMTKEEINKKQNGIVSLKFGELTNVITIDIDKPITRIKGEILDALSSQIYKISK